MLYNYNFEVEICQRNKETLQTGKERPENPVQKVSYWCKDYQWFLLRIR